MIIHEGSYWSNLTTFGGEICTKLCLLFMLQEHRIWGVDLSCFEAPDLELLRRSVSLGLPVFLNGEKYLFLCQSISTSALHLNTGKKLLSVFLTVVEIDNGFGQYCKYNTDSKEIDN